MPLPTLLVKGKLVPPDGREETKQILDQYVPMEYVVEWFVSRKNKTGVENRVLILKSETASGKSTAAPAYIYRDFVRPAVLIGDKRGLIITQPRILTAMENVNEMLKVPGYKDFLKLGHTIGWSTGANKLRPEKYGILSATIGTLTQVLRTATDEELMDRFRVILIDETHERDLQTDLTIYMLKNFMMRNQTNPRCPFLALMSATFEPEPFLRYFGLNGQTNFIYVSGSSFEKREMWDWNNAPDGSPRTVNNYTKAAADMAMSIHKDNPADTQGDILIFLPGTGEIKTTKEYLAKQVSQLGDQPVPAILSIDSDTIKTNGKDYRKMMAPLDTVRVKIEDKKRQASRKIILTTNVAETGLTLDDLKYVIDAGYNREIEFNPIHGLDSLLTKPAPKPRVIQRRGRVGRKFPGVFYPLYPRYIFDMLPDVQFPTILVSDFSALVLDICHEQGGKFDPWHIDMVDQPSPDALRYSMEKVYALGYIGQKHISTNPSLDELYKIGEIPLQSGLGLTRLGEIARSCFAVGVPLEISRMILAGYTWQYSIADLVSLGAYLISSTTGIAAKTDKGKVQVNWHKIYAFGLAIPELEGEDYIGRTRMLIGDEFIDLLMIHYAIMRCVSLSPKESRHNINEFCDSVGISKKVVTEALKNRESIIENMMAGGLNIMAWKENTIAGSPISILMRRVTQIKFCIYEGYRLNLLAATDDGYKMRTGLLVKTPKPYADSGKIKPVNAWLHECQPKYLVYAHASVKEEKPKKLGDNIPPATIRTTTHAVLDGFVTPDCDFI